MPNRLFGFGCCAVLGSNQSSQDFRQLRLSLRNDVTWTGWELAGEHVVKGGFNVDWLDYDIQKRNSENPRFIYEPWFNGFAIPHRVEFQAGDPDFGAQNTQLGLFIQDDWSPTDRLVLNLGVRWDYESHMMNYDYVTPSAIVDSLTKYQDRLFRPLNPGRYFTDGDDREPWLGAIQPRLGFSYALDSRNLTSVFGGWGIFYDRQLFDHAIEESFALQHPGYTLFFAPPGGPVGAGQIEWDERYLTDRQALLDLIADRTLSGKMAKEVLEAMGETGKPPGTIVEERGLRQVTDTGAIEAAVEAILAANPDKIAQYREKPTLFGWFVGQVMKAMKGQGNPALVNEVLKAKLGG